MLQKKIYIPKLIEGELWKRNHKNWKQKPSSFLFLSLSTLERKKSLEIWSEYRKWRKLRKIEYKTKSFRGFRVSDSMSFWFFFFCIFFFSMFWLRLPKQFFNFSSNFYGFFLFIYLKSYYFLQFDVSRIWFCFSFLFSFLSFSFIFFNQFLWVADFPIAFFYGRLIFLFIYSFYWCYFWAFFLSNY